MAKKTSFKDRVRVFNKRYFNHFTAWLVHHSIGPYGLLNHVGRKSGKSYQTTLLFQPRPLSFLVALPYGIHVDWYQNVLANGQCSVIWRKETYTVSSVETVDSEHAIPFFPLFTRSMFRLMGIKNFITMHYLPQSA